ncbi:MAG TPA: flavin reductase [Bacteroidia bacterium]|nr:flavin reductase [Bacteroidia bacterium]
MKTYTLDDINAMEQRFRTTFINSIAGFKSLNLVGTINEKGNTNLAPFNSIFHVGAHPPLLGMVCRPHEVERHTFENILSQKYYTLNHVHENILNAAHHCSARYDKFTSEFEVTGLTAYFSNSCKAPYVSESRVKIGLEFKEKLNLLSNQTTIIIGQIIEIMIDENAIKNDGFVNLSALDSLTVAGLDAYYKPLFISRLSYAKPNLPSQIMKE